MRCWPLDLRHLQRDSGFSAGFGAEGEPAYTLTSALTGGGNIPAVAVEYDMKVWPMAVQNAMRNNANPAGGSGIGEEDGPTFTLRADGGHPPSVAIVKTYPIDLRNALRDADREGRTGVGFGSEDDPSNTVTQGAVPAVAMAFDAWSSTVDISPERERVPCMKCGTRIGVCNAVEGDMDEPKYVVRRITPREAERLQGFPEVNYLNTKIMNRDEAIVFALLNKDLIVNPSEGKIFRTRGPGGLPLATPIEIEGSIPKKGYKVFTLHEGGIHWQVYFHRVIWIAIHGIPPEGMVVDHINNNTLDNRISNLQLLTGAENSTKAANDGRYLCGNDNPQTKLPVEMRSVVYSEYLAGAGTYQQLAEKYGVSKARIAQIVQNKGYTDVEFKGKPAPDTARYKALGNSMTVNVMAWIAKRILMVENGEL